VHHTHKCGWEGTGGGTSSRRHLGSGAVTLVDGRWCRGVSKLRLAGDLL
jgi:hypothetical protein